MPTDTTSIAYAGRLVQKGLRAVWNLFQAGVILYGLATIAFVILRLVVGERSNTVAFTNNFIPWLAGGALIAALVGLLARRRWLLVACQVPMLATFAVLYGGLLLPRSTSAEVEHGPQLRVVTYNIQSGRSDPQRVTDQIASLQADVVGLQEHGPAHQVLFETQLADQFPYQVHFPKLPVHGVGLLSRYPILETELFAPLPDSMGHLRAVIDVNGVRVTVLVIHPRPPRGWEVPFHYDDRLRDAELAAVREQILPRESGPVLVLCDCNMTDQSDAYRAMTRRLDDAFREAGYGLDFSWPMDRWILPPMLRIDYVWYNDYFGALSARTMRDSATSDHRPVLAVLALKEKPSSS